MKTKDTNSIGDDKQHKSTARRKLLKSAVLAAGGVAALPTSWTKPVVDTVFLPAHAATSCQTICEIAQSTGVHNTLVKLLSDTGLLDTVCSATELTVWAPTDDAFEAISDVKLSEQQLKDILLYHTKPGTQPANSYRETENTKPNVAPSVPACNGIVHVIDQVLVPPGTLPKS